MLQCELLSLSLSHTEPQHWSPCSLSTSVTYLCHSLHTARIKNCTSLVSTSFRSSLYVPNCEMNHAFCLYTLWQDIKGDFCFCTYPQVLLGITISWLICYILTIYNVLPTDPKRYGYMARTDLKGDVMSQAPWFTFPYPGKEASKLSSEVTSNKN